MTGPRRVVHVINGLELGGAERMLVKLCLATDRARIDPVVISLTTAGPLAEPLRDAGIPVIAMHLRPRPTAALRCAQLVGEIRRHQPDLVQTWLYKSDLIGGLAARWCGVPVAWNLRQSNLDPLTSTPTNRAAAWLGARLSRRLPRAIACVSAEALAHHAALGYDRSLMTVLPNGFDTDVFRPDPTARTRFRSHHGIPADADVLGLVGRFDPQKDHGNLLDAVALLRTEPPVYVVLAGTGVTDAAIAPLVPAVIDRDRLHVLGPISEVSEVAALDAALDIAVSSSAYGEGYSNSLGEALACGVCCVATRSGNADELIGGSGIVVPPRDAAALASGIEAVLAWGPDQRARRGADGRARIIATASIDAIADQYATFHEEVIDHVRIRRVPRTTVRA